MEMPPPLAAHQDVPVSIFDNTWGATLGFVASLGRRGVPLHFYGAGVGHWSRYATRHDDCPSVDDSENFLPWLRQRIRSGEIVRVAPTSDQLVYYLALLREEFPAEVQRTIAPLAEVEDNLIKTRFAARCAQLGKSVPLHATPDNLDDALAAAERLGYPLVLKPKSHIAVGWSERGCVIHDDAALRGQFAPYTAPAGQEALMARYPELRWPLLQQYVPSARNQVYSVSGFKDADTGIVAACVSYKQSQWPPDVGTSTRQVAWADERILQAGLATIDRLVSRGIFELELLVDGDELLAIDLNPRAFGFINLDIARGNDLPWLWFLSTMDPVQTAAIEPAGSMLEARMLIPYWAGCVAEFLFGLRKRGAQRRQHGVSDGAQWVSMLGSSEDMVPLVLGNLHLLRHPRSLLRQLVATGFAVQKEPLAR